MSKLISLAVTISSLVVIYGWVNDIEVLKSLSPNWVTMKISTAVSFLMSGIMLFFLESSVTHKNKKSELIVSMSSMAIFFLMASLLFEQITGANINASTLFIEEDPNEVVLSVKAGMPSIGTMANFILISIVGLCALFNTANFYKRVKRISTAIMSITLVSLLGYFINSPFLYYYWPGKSTGMAFHTTLLFGLIALCMFLIRKKQEDK